MSAGGHVLAVRFLLTLLQHTASGLWKGRHIQPVRYKLVPRDISVVARDDSKASESGGRIRKKVWNNTIITMRSVRNTECESTLGELLRAASGTFRPELVRIVGEYLWMEVAIGTCLDVRGAGRGLHMFHPMIDTWELCTVIDVDDKSVRVATVDRLHPYPFFYPERGDCRNITTLSLTDAADAARIRPPLSQSQSAHGDHWHTGVGAVSDLRPYDLLDCLWLDSPDPFSGIGALAKVQRVQRGSETEYDARSGRGTIVEEGHTLTGRWRVAEVVANINSALWILWVQPYHSSDHQAACREWIPIDSARLAPYRSRTPLPTISKT